MMKRLRVQQQKNLWEALIEKHYNHEFPKLYRVKFNKHGMVIDQAYRYAENHFPTLMKMFIIEAERMRKNI